MLSDMNANPSRSPHPDIELAEDALAGDPEAAAAIIEMLRSPQMVGYLRAKGASASMADDVIADLIGDCFGGQRAKGGLHRLLGRYNGGSPLFAFLRRTALNRYIDIIRELQRKPTTSLDSENAPELASPADTVETEDAITSLLLNAIIAARSKIDPERLIAVRLIESYRVPQNRVGSILGWHESKTSRTKSDFLDEFRTRIMDEVRRRDPWLHLEWDDFLSLCSESLDLFAV